MGTLNLSPISASLNSGNQSSFYDAYAAYTASLADIGEYAVDNETYNDGSQDIFIITRTVLLFDGAVLNGMSIEAASLYVKPSVLIIDSPFDVVVQQTLSNNPPGIADFNKDLYSGEYGSISASSLSVGDYSQIALDTSIINIGGLTRLGLRNSNELYATAPSGQEYAEFSSVVLSLNYVNTAPVDVPVYIECKWGRHYKRWDNILCSAGYSIDNMVVNSHERNTDLYANGVQVTSEPASPVEGRWYVG